MPHSDQDYEHPNHVELDNLKFEVVIFKPQTHKPQSILEINGKKIRKHSLRASQEETLACYRQYIDEIIEGDHNFDIMAPKAQKFKMPQNANVTFKAELIKSKLFPPSRLLNDEGCSTGDSSWIGAWSVEQQTKEEEDVSSDKENEVEVADVEEDNVPSKSPTMKT
uniref:Uncharacterized protein n=1 Tax=Cannabis sativa TaxID=3483 RepID=A0A803QGY1_CANSA